MFDVKINNADWKKSQEDIIETIASLILEHASDNINNKIYGSGIIADQGGLEASGFIERNGHYSRTVGFSAPYASAIEFGRDAGKMPPVEPIISWAKRKLRKSEKEAKSMGWAVAKKIKKEGLEPRPFLRDAIERAKQDVR